MLYALNRKEQFEDNETIIVNLGETPEELSDIIAYVSFRYNALLEEEPIPMRLIGLIIEKDFHGRIAAFPDPLPEALLKEIFSEDWSGSHPFKWKKNSLMAVDISGAEEKGRGDLFGLSPLSITIDQNTDDNIMNDIVAYWNHHRRKEER